jgi:response regulator RpfG family c-di-GMP phosphodiesterase
LKMSDKILIVDDEAAVVASLKRTLFKEFRVDTATGAQQALNAMESSGPYAVVMSDLSMPGMNGIELLALVKKSWPDTVRILLTGHVEIDAAVRAVNHGYIYRFLTKPCPTDELVAALRAALDQYHQGIAEREVLEQTLMGALTVLTEILGMVHPAAFGRVGALRRYALHMASDLKLTEIWRVEAAALLSQIGLVTVPAETLEKYYLDEPFNEDEAAAFASHPRVGHGLLEPIPRLRTIAGMIRGQQQPYRPSEPDQSPAESFMTTGAQILHAALAFDQLSTAGYETHNALAKMRGRAGEYAPRLLDSLAKLDSAEAESEAERIGDAFGNLGPSAQGEKELPLDAIATQVWDVLNDHSESRTAIQSQTPSNIPACSTVPKHRAPNDAIENLLSSLNEHFDALYCGLPAWEDRMLLRESYVLGRDAFCDTAGRFFDQNRESATSVAAELELTISQMDQTSVTGEQLQQRLKSLVTAVNLATRLASLADQRPRADSQWSGRDVRRSIK